MGRDRHEVIAVRTGVRTGVTGGGEVAGGRCSAGPNEHTLGMATAAFNRVWRQRWAHAACRGCRGDVSMAQWQLLFARCPAARPSVGQLRESWRGARAADCVPWQGVQVWPRGRVRVIRTRVSGADAAGAARTGGLPGGLPVHAGGLPAAGLGDQLPVALGHRRLHDRRVGHHRAVPGARRRAVACSGYPCYG